MAADDFGDLERACACIGLRGLKSEDWEAPELFDEPDKCTLVMVPQEWIDRGWREHAFAVGLCQLFLQRYGWPALVRVLVHLDDAVAFFEAMEQKQQSAD